MWRERMTIQEVLRDIRLYESYCPQPYVRWADAIEAEMKRLKFDSKVRTESHNKERVSLLNQILLHKQERDQARQERDMSEQALSDSKDAEIERLTHIIQKNAELSAEIELLKTVANRGGHLAVANAEIDRLREALNMVVTSGTGWDTGEYVDTCDDGRTPAEVAKATLAGKENQ